MTEAEEEDDDMREFRFRYSERRFFTASLEDDVAKAEELLAQAPDDPFVRRTVVRTMFAQIEGLCAEAMDWARYYAAEGSDHRDRYTAPERADLDEGKHMKTKDRVRFALSLVGRGAEVLPSIEYGDGGWEALCEGFAVRDRLMHPKDPDDVSVSDVDLGQVRRGRAWLVGVIQTQERALQSTLAKHSMQAFREWQQKKGDAGA